MSAADKFKEHLAECPNCDNTDPTKLCAIGQALLVKLVKDNGVFEKIQKEK